MANFLLLVVCLIAGAWVRRDRHIPVDSVHFLNRLVLSLCLPAVALETFHEIQWSWQTLLPGLMPWLAMLLSMVVVTPVCRWFRLSRQTTGAMVLTCGLANTAFLGYPMVEAFYGHEALQTAVVIDQLGTFLALSTLGIAVASYFGDRGCSAGVMLKRVLTFPSMIALGLAFATRGIVYPQAFHELLIKLGSLLSPLALFSVGFQLRFGREGLKAAFPALSMGLLFKLVLLPLVVWVVYAYGFGMSMPQTRITVIQAGMAPMVVAGMIAAEYGLDAKLASLMIGVGILVSLLTVPAWVGLMM